ncbi:hypothetical protein B0H17DRAFT_1300243 [Mycena rosella]|uniref:Uncharacterized protein n=1 Tax=Mycena rosella TaxID=1033263 RepID=A0AAD7GGE3_MYCRO|nr:hypothetical protein B0H17DRAFT_1300243 [Mycena rosella]
MFLDFRILYPRLEIRGGGSLSQEFLDPARSRACLSGNCPDGGELLGPKGSTNPPPPLFIHLTFSVTIAPLRLDLISEEPVQFANPLTRSQPMLFTSPGKPRPRFQPQHNPPTDAEISGVRRVIAASYQWFMRTLEATSRRWHPGRGFVTVQGVVEGADVERGAGAPWVPWVPARHPTTIDAVLNRRYCGSNRVVRTFGAESAIPGREWKEDAEKNRMAGLKRCRRRRIEKAGEEEKEAD